MLLKLDKLSSLIASYRLISLISNLFERVTEQRLSSYLEEVGFFYKYQSKLVYAYCVTNKSGPI